MENYCLRISKFFENGLSQDAWHRELLRRMTLEIGDLRPALFDETTFLPVDELRSFRHLFRNLYARFLDPERTRLVQLRVGPAVSAFVRSHEVYVRTMRDIANAL